MLGAVPWGLPPLVPSPFVLDSQQPLRLDLFLFFLHGGQAADNCGGCGPCTAPLAARGFSQLRVEDSPGQKESRLREPL